ncbi:MAG: hypothetical protein IJ867_01000 [Clostridia bacterium]|nr:hypothetical protein [Clostridia bacterium]
MEFDKEKVKLKIAISKIQEENDIVMGRKLKNVFKLVGTVAAVLFLGTGIVFAVNVAQKEDKKEDYRGLGRGVDTAIDNGYVERPEMDYTKQVTSVVDEEKVVDNITVEAKVNNFLMDDRNISLEFEFVFGENIEDYVDFDKYSKFFIKDLVIRDETDEMISEGTGTNIFVKSRDGESHTMLVVCNIFGEDFPKSRELKLSFGRLSISDEQYEKTVTIVGKWEIDLDVPEKMYHRTEEYYNVISCSNSDFEVYTSKVTDTGFEIGLYINNIENLGPNIHQELRDAEDKMKEELYEKYNIDENASPEELRKVQDEKVDIMNSDEAYKKLILKLLVANRPIDIIGDYTINQKILAGEEVDLENETYDKKSYIQNSNGEKFYCTLSPSRKSESRYLEGNKFHFYETFELTKVDSTDKLTVVLYYRGEAVTIEFEKIK